MSEQLELLGTRKFNRNSSDSLQLQHERGHFTHLLLVLNGTTFHHKDRITAKLRHNGGTIVVIDRVAASDLIAITDLKLGIPSFGSGLPDDKSLYNDGQLGLENGATYLTQMYNFNTICVPVGSIFLDDATFEVTVDTGVVNLATAVGDGPSGDAKLSFYLVDAGLAPAHVLQYDCTFDIESNQKLVREMYLTSKDGGSLFPSNVPFNDPNFFNGVEPLDVIVQLDIDNQSKIADLRGFGALTSIFGEMSRPAASIVRLFKDSDSTPSNIWVKLSGDDRDKVSMIAVREVMIPSLTVAGHAATIDSQLRKAESLEKTSPDAARAYVATGLSAPSYVLQDMKEQIPATI